jgi:hypothetical protein
MLDVQLRRICLNKRDAEERLQVYTIMPGFVLLESMNRYLYSTPYFHGHLMSAEYQIRAWALFHNFQPYCPCAKIRQKYRSPFHKLNGFVYHENCLQNLLIASSLGGRYATNTKR